LPGRCTIRADRSQTGTRNLTDLSPKSQTRAHLPLTAREDAGLNQKRHGGGNDG
jgi:hypothetical protein